MSLIQKVININKIIINIKFSKIIRKIKKKEAFIYNYINELIT